MINDKMKKKDDFKEKLINRSFNAIEQKRKEFENNPSNSKHYYKKLKRLITEQINLDLSNYRDNYLKRRITHRISFINITSFKDYIVYLRNHPEEKKKIKDNLTIHTTNWLRDITPFKILEKDIFPKIIKKKLKLSRDKQIIRILSAPCSSGQEPYSIAMIIEEIIKKKSYQLILKSLLVISNQTF